MTAGEPGPALDGTGAAEAAEVAAFWESHYGRRDQIWSGRPNARLVEVTSALAPGRALDLGCGEGADAVWLARRGWRVCAIDVSATALARASALAHAEGVETGIDFQQHDLGRWSPSGSFDLVSAHYLQSPVFLPREVILRRAAAAVAVGGLLLVVEHGSAPSWAREQHPHARFLTPEQALDTLELEPGAWETERLEAVERKAAGPDHLHGTVSDTVVAVRRRRATGRAGAAGGQVSGR